MRSGTNRFGICVRGRKSGAAGGSPMTEKCRFFPLDDGLIAREMATFFVLTIPMIRFIFWKYL